MKTTSYLLCVLFVAIQSAVFSASRAESLSVPLEGSWKVTATTGENDEKFYTLTITKEEKKFGGTFVEDGKDESRELSRVKVDGKKINIEIDIEVETQKGILKIITEEKESGKLTGKWSIEDTAGTEYLSGELVATKEIEATLPGKWDAVATLPNGNERTSVTTIEGTGPDYKGRSESERGTTEIPKIHQEDKHVSIEIPRERDGRAMIIKIKAALEGTTLTGKWTLLDDAGTETATGDWKATKRNEFLFEGKWNLVAIDPDDKEVKVTLDITQKEGVYGGRAEFEKGALDLKEVTHKKGAVSISVPYESDGTQGLITLKGKAAGSEIKGTWSFVSTDGSVTEDGDWSASRGDSSKKDAPKGLRGRE
jgi:hypothetical protein